MLLAVCRKRAWSVSFSVWSACVMRAEDLSMHCLQLEICWASFRSLWAWKHWGKEKGNISEKSQSKSNHGFKERGIKYCRIKASEVTRGKKIIRKEQIRRKDDWCIWSFFGFHSLVEKAKHSQYIYFSPIFLQNQNCKLLIFCYIFKESGQNNPK